MRVVVICPEPDRVLQLPDSVASILSDLGCRVTIGRFDLGELDEEALLERPPNIVVVDAGSELDRASRCIARMRQFEPLAETPVLLCVNIDRLPGLDFSLGFDDFTLAPVVPAELYARLRQLDWRTATFGSEEVLKVGDLVIDVAGYEAHLRGRRIEFTHQEFELLRFLAQNRGRVFTREQLLQKVWGYQYCGGTRTVDIHVRRVRSKLGAVASTLIETVRNVGYKMRTNWPEAADEGGEAAEAADAGGAGSP